MSQQRNLQMMVGAALLLIRTNFPCGNIKEKSLIKVLTNSHVDIIRLREREKYVVVRDLINFLLHNNHIVDNGGGIFSLSEGSYIQPCPPIPPPPIYPSAANSPSCQPPVYQQAEKAHSEVVQKNAISSCIAKVDELQRELAETKAELQTTKRSIEALQTVVADLKEIVDRNDARRAWLEVKLRNAGLNY
jgi:hypothetical protein